MGLGAKFQTPEMSRCVTTTTFLFIDGQESRLKPNKDLIIENFVNETCTSFHSRVLCECPRVLEVIVQAKGFAVWARKADCRSTHAPDVLVEVLSPHRVKESPVFRPQP
uniref:Uncharacterized protein n=1 Tax=Octactis speculum TaxID=3111310 RepID=A0A7S2DNX9_9STRA